MKYRIAHKTWYTYSDIVPICHNLTHLAPRTTPTQKCLEYQLTIDPPPAFLSREDDYFGNGIECFSIEVAHRKLEIVANSMVEVEPTTVDRATQNCAWEKCVLKRAIDHAKDRSQIDRDAVLSQFCYPSPHVPELPGLYEYAARSFPPRRPVLSAIADLSARMHRDFKFDARATTVNTPLLNVLRQRRGVCQDFAHLAIGCLRAMGLAARYASGYLRTNPPPGKPRLIGADASHAWCSCWCGPHGWIDLDTTNNFFTEDSHVTIAWGRDYGDVCPIQGVFIGGGDHRIGVSVDMALVESQ